MTHLQCEEFNDNQKNFSSEEKQDNVFKYIVTIQFQLTCGRWTKEEHERFIQALSLYGKNWKKVQDHLGTRSSAQIRSHAQKFFNRLEKECNLQVNKVKSQQIKEIFQKYISEKQSIKRPGNLQTQKEATVGNEINVCQVPELYINLNQEELSLKQKEQRVLLELRQIINQRLILHQLANLLGKKEMAGIQEEQSNLSEASSFLKFNNIHQESINIINNDVPSQSKLQSDDLEQPEVSKRVKCESNESCSK